MMTPYFMIIRILALILMNVYSSNSALGLNILSSPSNAKTICVIGGGAAGYFSAIECARVLRTANSDPDKFQVVILEATSAVLSKVLISGGGRCNVMHNPDKGVKEISKGYPRGNKELLGPFNNQFGPWDTYDWFTKRAVDLKTEDDGRVFPITDKSSTIAGALLAEAKKLGVRVVCGAKVSGIQSINIDGDTGDSASFAVDFSMKNGDQLDSSSKEEGAESTSSTGMPSASSLFCHCVVLATGSSRVGYSIVKGLGHRLMNPIPSLFSLKIKDENIVKLSGTTCKNVQVKINLSAKDIPKMTSISTDDASKLKSLLRPQQLPSYTQRGPLLFTHQGISGPAALRLSAHGAKLLHCLNYVANISINFLPEYSEEDILECLEDEKMRHPKRLASKGFPYIKNIVVDDASVDYNDYDYSNTTDGTDDDEKEEVGLSMQSNIKAPKISRRLWQFILQRSIPPAAVKPSVPRKGNAAAASAAVVVSTKDTVVKPSALGATTPTVSALEKTWSQLTRADLELIVKEITNSGHLVEGRGEYRDEFVTCGGVDLKEINFDTMESKMTPGLFLAGEVLDIDGITGGYNFQSAWTTGWISGHNAAIKVAGIVESV